MKTGIDRTAWKDGNKPRGKLDLNLKIRIRIVITLEIDVWEGYM